MISATGNISINNDGVLVKLQFERYYLSDQIERIRVYGKEKEIKIQSDRPFIRANNFKKAVKWQIISAPTKDMFKFPVFINSIFITLQQILDKEDGHKTKWDWSMHPKNAK